MILGVIHAGRAKGAHSVLDPKSQATLAALEDLSTPNIRSTRSARRPGTRDRRYAKDAYYGGNPWYLATLAVAEFYFKLTIALRSGAGCRRPTENASFRQRLSGEKLR